MNILKLIYEAGLQDEYKPKRPINQELCNKLKSNFVIHDHYSTGAARHHYDIRLEKACVLKSWASKNFTNAVENPGVKVLAIQVQDHNLEYFDFKGIIKNGYGAGRVEIWDTGLYELIRWTNNYIIVNFKGTKMNGIFVFIRVGKHSWLLFRKNKKS